MKAGIQGPLLLFISAVAFLATYLTIQFQPVTQIAQLGWMFITAMVLIIAWVFLFLGAFTILASFKPEVKKA